MQNCDAHEKKVGVELLYNLVHRKFNQFGDQTRWSQDAVEKASTQLREPSSPRLRVRDQSQIALIQPIHGQGYTLLFLDRMHLLFRGVLVV